MIILIIIIIIIITMTIHGALHPKSDVDRIYVPRGKGGRGLLGCEGCIRVEENSLGWYINHSPEQLLQLTKDSFHFISFHFIFSNQILNLGQCH